MVGYEANYAGTSFIKVGDVGKLKFGSKLFNVTADRVMVEFIENPPHNKAKGGVLFSDR